VTPQEVHDHEQARATTATSFAPIARRRAAAAPQAAARARAGEGAGPSLQTPVQVQRSRAPSAPRAARISARPTTFATGSTCCGCRAKSRPPRVPPNTPAPRRSAKRRSTQETARWRARLTRWETEGSARPTTATSQA
jgi:hypothetical protein